MRRRVGEGGGRERKGGKRGEKENQVLTLL